MGSFDTPGKLAVLSLIFVCHFDAKSIRDAPLSINVFMPSQRRC